MELKYGKVAKRGFIFGSNRTFMELKLQRLLQKIWFPVCSNRTFMELKFGLFVSAL